jgi:hypothetical protein
LQSHAHMGDESSGDEGPKGPFRPHPVLLDDEEDGDARRREDGGGGSGAGDDSYDGGGEAGAGSDGRYDDGPDSDDGGGEGGDEGEGGEVVITTGACPVWVTPAQTVVAACVGGCGPCTHAA